MKERVLPALLGGEAAVSELNPEEVARQYDDVDLTAKQRMCKVKDRLPLLDSLIPISTNDKFKLARRNGSEADAAPFLASVDTGRVCDLNGIVERERQAERWFAAKIDNLVAFERNLCLRWRREDASRQA